MFCVVTGAAGFMGSHLVTALLDKGHEVLGIDDLSGGFMENVDRRSRFIARDLSEGPIRLNIFKPDILFHLAADAAEGLSQFTPISSTRNNTLAYINTLTSCIKAGVKRIVLTSSMVRYGEGIPPFSEKSPANPVSIYGINKVSMENMTQTMAKAYGFDYTIIVPHNVFGIQQNLSDPYRNIVGIFMNRIMKNLPPIIYGDGKQTRAFTYIDDFTPYIVDAGFRDNCINETINIGTAKAVSINHVARVVLKAMDSKLKPIYLPDRPSEVKHAFCTAFKAKQLLNYKTTTSFEEGVQKMAGWAKTRGPQEFKYVDLELETPQTPKTWSNREM